MATKDDKPGLLSKVAMFVRNPTRDWSELEQAGDGESSGYDKQALKAMIERKRQNDFVRKREFDQLRKLRNRDPVALANMARPSFFQTSVPNDLDGRADTLKKIDEIEAQMSRQWWKAKAQDTQPPDGSGANRADTKPNSELLSEDEDGNPDQRAFASTEPLMRAPGGDDAAEDFAPTQMAGDPLSVPASEMLDGTDGKFESSISFSASRLFGAEVDEMATDPELEEAAIRFANSDDDGAEQGLLAALRASELVPLAAHSWVAALLDLYRATGDAAAFDAATREFVLYLDGAFPVWTALSEGSVADEATANQGAGGCLWESPAQLGSKHMEALRAAMESHPMPWYLGWGALQEIEPDAVPLLDALFGSLCEEAVSLRFDGADVLARALRAITPSGNRMVDRSWWRVRLNALRAMGMQDDFELAALDYCITYEAAPPEWIDAPCSIVSDGMATDQSVPAHDAGTRTVHMGVDMAAATQDLVLVLRGEILGDASLALSELDSAQVRGNRMAIDCSKLIRVDFAAAGSILNWVAMRQADGKQVQFQNVHRLVAAFFNVIVINESAKVIPRAI